MPDMTSEPTATHAGTAVHETLESTFDVPPDGLRVVCIDQVLPDSRSASVTPVPAVFVKPPTAVQLVLEVHDTLAKALALAPAALGVAWIAQLPPLHDSASVSELPPLLVYAPTAVHALGVAHETPYRRLDLEPLGFGVACIDQAPPLHCSARVTSVPAVLVYDATAVHCVVDGQETLRSTLLLLPAGFGVGCTVHAPLLQRSASVKPVPLALLDQPTAVQSVVEGHETLRSRLTLVGWGVGWIVHAEPFQRSASVVRMPEALTESPTAVHAFAAAQATPDNELAVASEGLGVDTIDQALPFQRSAIVTVVPEAFTLLPTAMQAALDVHATPASDVACAPAGSGMVCSAQPCTVNGSQADVAAL